MRRLVRLILAMPLIAIWLVITPMYTIMLIFYELHCWAYKSPYRVMTFKEHFIDDPKKFFKGLW